MYSLFTLSRLTTKLTGDFGAQRKSRPVQRLVSRCHQEQVRLLQSLREICLRQTGNKKYSDKWWIGTIPPYAPKYLKSGLRWLPLDNVDIPFNDIFQSRTRCGKCDFEIS